MPFRSFVARSTLRLQVAPTFTASKSSTHTHPGVFGHPRAEAFPTSAKPSLRRVITVENTSSWTKSSNTVKLPNLREILAANHTGARFCVHMLEMSISLIRKLRLSRHRWRVSHRIEMVGNLTRNAASLTAETGRIHRSMFVDPFEVFYHKMRTRIVIKNHILHINCAFGTSLDFRFIFCCFKTASPKGWLNATVVFHLKLMCHGRNLSTGQIPNKKQHFMVAFNSFCLPQIL
jgi:hypothetical protein